MTTRLVLTLLVALIGTGASCGGDSRPGDAGVDAGTRSDAGSGCRPGCAASDTCCYGIIESAYVCVDLLSTSSHCGACNASCPIGAVCMAATCR